MYLQTSPPTRTANFVCSDMCQLLPFTAFGTMRCPAALASAAASAPDMRPGRSNEASALVVRLSRLSQPER